MVEALQGVGNKIVGLILAASTAMSGLVGTAQTAVVYKAVPAASVSATTTILVSPVPMATAAVLMPGLLPVVVINSKTVASGTAPIAKTKTIAAPKLNPVHGATTQNVPQKLAVQIVTATVLNPTITAQWLLDNTKLSFKQKLGGTFEAIFTAGTGSGALTWGLNDAFIGGSGTIPKFAFSASCNPPLGVPPPDDLDQTPFFSIRTSYSCTIGFAATSGGDQTLHSKNLQFETGPGRLIVATPPSMNTVLSDELNTGGFVFTNQDTNPVTVTGLTLDVSYVGLSTVNGPIVLRFPDPSTGSSLFDYDMEKLPAVPGAQFSYATTGVTVPLSFMIGASNQKLLPIEIVNAHTLSISGINPTVTVTLRSASLSANDIPLAITTPQLQWTCTVALGGYDPNATSGAFADGTVCR